MHDRTIQLLIDYSRCIIAFLIMIPEMCNDELVAIYNELFHRIVGHNYTLRDSGFQGCGYIIAEYQTSQVTMNASEVFYHISKCEQRLIEHVNSFINGCRLINKECTFIHSEAKLLAYIFIIIGLYNLKRD